MLHRFKDWMRLREDFASTFGQEKGKWQEITADTIQADPSIAQELYDIVQAGYAPLGGNKSTEFSSADAIIQGFQAGEITVIKAVDMDDNPDIDAAIAWKGTKFGNKITMGTAKPSFKPSSGEMVNKSGEMLKQSPFYIEASGAYANLILKNTGAKPILDEQTVREMLPGKKLIWHGEHPNLDPNSPRFPENPEPVFPKAVATFAQHPGWYSRTLNDGKWHTKIMIGLPDMRMARGPGAPSGDASPVPAPSQGKDKPDAAPGVGGLPGLKPADMGGMPKMEWSHWPHGGKRRRRNG